MCVTDRFPKRKQDLSAQNMEVVGWSRTVDNDPVTVVDLTNFKVICVLLKDKEQERRGEEVTNNVIHVVFMEYLSIMAI